MKVIIEIEEQDDMQKIQPFLQSLGTVNIQVDYLQQRYTRQEAGIQAMDGNFEHIPVLWISAIHAGMTCSYRLVYNDESSGLGV